MRLPSVLSALDLPLAELQAARLDGELFSIDGCFSPLDEIEQSHHRGASLATSLPGRLIAEQLSAAWVFGALESPPARHQLCARIDARIRPASTARIDLREVVIDDADIATIGGMRLTTPLRTVVDLARFAPDFNATHRAIIARLMQFGSFGPDECRQMLDRRRNLPGKRAALTRILASCP